MTDHFARTERAASSPSLAELHQLCHEDYIKGQQQRATPHLSPSYAALTLADLGPAPEPTDLDVAIRVAQQLIDSDQLLSVREALRLLLRAIGAEPDTTPTPDTQPPAPAPRCQAAHPDDPTPCDGRPVVTVLDATNAGASGCEHHGARLLASLDGGRVYPLTDAPDGAAIRVFKTAGQLHPFCWYEDAPRTEPSQLSHAETRRRSEGQ